MSEKIIFLDIHGPLQSARVFFDDAVIYDGAEVYDRLDPLGIAFLKRLCKNTGAKIVLNSTLNKNDEAYIEKLFKYNGFIDFFEYVHKFWKTSFNVSSFSKYDAIHGWLARAKKRGEDITHHVVLDDMQINDTYSNAYTNQVLVDMDLGLTIADYKKSCTLLGVRSDLLII